MTQEELVQEIEKKEAELRELTGLPSYFVVEGQVIDNRQRITDLRFHLRDLRAELTGRSSMQGPDLEV